MKILVTGANGFVGKVLCSALYKQGHVVRAAVRVENTVCDDFDQVVVCAIDGQTDWESALCGVDVVIHLAARVHVMHDTSDDPLEAFRRVNVAGTERLGRSAAASGVKRFVFVSSIKVNGESTVPIPTLTLPLKGQEQFSEFDAPNPQDPYGISKWEAEQALHRVSAETGLEVVIVRPPLVYGAGVKGNFAQMLKVLARGIPLPLAAVTNLRSLIYLGNLVDALMLCATHPAAIGQTYLLSDGEDISTPDLLRQLGVAMAHPARLFYCPQALLKLAGSLTGRADQIERLLGCLQIDSSKIRRELGWTPPYTLELGLRITAGKQQTNP